MSAPGRDGNGEGEGGGGGAGERADETPNPRTSAPATQRAVTFPPARWDRESGVISSTQNHGAASTRDPGSLAGDSSERLTEARAREILGERFRAADLAIQPDYPFHERDLAVTLDAYDPKKKVGYAFLSHADADVVTDFDEAAELALAQLAYDNVCHVLVVHDRDAPTRDALDRLVDAFFARLPWA